MGFKRTIKGCIGGSLDVSIGNSEKAQMRFECTVKRCIGKSLDVFIRNSEKEKAQTIFIESLKHIANQNDPEIFFYNEGEKDFFYKIKDEVKGLDKIKKTIFCDDLSIKNILGVEKDDIKYLKNLQLNVIDIEFEKYLKERVREISPKIPLFFSHFAIFSFKDKDKDEKKYFLRFETDVESKRWWFSANVSEDQIDRLKHTWKEGIVGQIKG